MEKSSFSWKWKSLTHVRPEFYQTNTFVVGGYQWIIKYRKNETSIGGKESISILLELLSAGDVSLLFRLYVNAINGERVALVSDNHKKFLKREVVTTLSETSSEEILWNKVSGFVDNDTLKLECELKILGFPPTYEGVEVMESPKWDIEIVVKGHKFYAHRLFLCNASAKFDRLIKLSNNSNLLIDDIEPEVFRKFLSYLYFEKIDETNIEALNDFALSYDLNTLRDICSNLMAPIAVDNVCLKLKEANRFEMPLLKKNYIAFIKLNRKEVTDFAFTHCLFDTLFSEEEANS